MASASTATTTAIRIGRIQKMPLFVTLVVLVLVFVIHSLLLITPLPSSADFSHHEQQFEGPFKEYSTQKIRDEWLKSREEIQELKQKLELLRSHLSNANANGEATTNPIPMLSPGEESKSKQHQQNISLEQKKSQQEYSSSSSPYCALISPPIPSTLGFWNSHLASIVEASRHDLDKRWILHDYTAQLLHLVSPDRLARSTMSLPHDWTPVQNVLQILYHRYQFITSTLSNSTTTTTNTTINNDSSIPYTTTNPKQPRKLKILIMGGSVIVGVNCRKIVKDYNLGMLMPNRLCTWTHRLESFVNKILGGPYIEVHKIALGGTNSQTGYVLWDSDFLPEESKNPDIVIHAYSTNDMHILTALQAKEGNLTLRDKVLEMTQNFVRSVLQTPKSCNEEAATATAPPLLLHLDDYLGNEQKEILATTELAQAIMVLANYYGFVSMSYANVVRDIIYGDTLEHWISPRGWYQNDDPRLGMMREIHPEMGMHIIATWVTAYNLLHLALTFCAIEPFWKATHSSTEKIQGRIATTALSNSYQATFGLPPLRANPVISGKPLGRPLGLPPPLNATLSLENISSVWRATKPVSGANKNCPVLSLETVAPRCPMSWFSGLSKLGKNESYAHDLFSTRNSWVQDNTGWDINTEGNKLGISPVPGSVRPLFKVRFPTFSHFQITMLYMKSYGPRWENSQVSMVVTMNDAGLVKQDLLDGFHEKQTSEIYTHIANVQVPLSMLNNINTSNETTTPWMQLSIRHVGGQTFKIMGLAICQQLEL